MDYIRLYCKKKQQQQQKVKQCMFFNSGHRHPFSIPQRNIVFTYAYRHNLASKSHDVAGSYMYGIAGGPHRSCFSIFQFGTFLSLEHSLSLSATLVYRQWHTVPLSTKEQQIGRLSTTEANPGRCKQVSTYRAPTTNQSTIPPKSTMGASELLD